MLCLPLAPLIPTRIVPRARPAQQSPQSTAREFLRRVDGGAGIRPEGSARRDPRRLLSLGYTLKHKLELFDTTFYLTNVRQNDHIRLYLAYVAQGDTRIARPRIFYKDVSLIWRSASHLARLGGDPWIRKGDVVEKRDGADVSLWSQQPY